MHAILLRSVRTAGGKSLETLEALSNDKATMEAQLAMQASPEATRQQPRAAPYRAATP